MGLPKKVILTECWARDGLQNQVKYIPTDQKINMIERIVDSGFKRVEVTSFSHPKYVPQFKDAEELLEKLHKNSDVSYKATCVNNRALLRAIDTVEKGYGPNEVSFVIAASEEYNKVNVKMTQKQLINQIDGMINSAKDAGLEVLISVSTAFGCPYKGTVETEDVLRLVDHFSTKGVDRITIGDTSGMANPKQSYQLYTILKENYGEDIPIIAHFHDTKGWGISNAYAALQAGVNHFDVSLGGIGGPPAERIGSQSGNTGNVCTEDFVFLLNDLGIDAGIDLEKLKGVGEYSENMLGMQRSQILRSI
ncbi:hydroxymethylglutaryl-CoA lyase [Ornithinibacillus halophilus]|uniref:Hydroxymethylglutaryl-CoA lyase n=1 Tax=Ornithinibacillus halophilus TaxID=930117 RepID=A0A1M5GL84_9BACI|nr:hydroxymethylglutaryl-CoA lyase [Ornithinibacillus halophilus]SHG04477.1 hydroxymethylglutaryl-CoA lyase [Ornithinibacillus halophilus]